MTEKDKYSETERLVCYKHKDGGVELSMIFNKETKTVDISLMMFHRTDEPTLEPMGEDAYSAAYGHWQTEIICLGADDIEFLHLKSTELFGQQNEYFMNGMPGQQDQKGIYEQKNIKRI